MLYDEDECLPLSGIQHFAFCRRQFALIHLERLWQENTLTYSGRVLHQRADDPFVVESRGTVLISRSVPLLSRELGLYGVADVVEFHLNHQAGTALAGREGLWLPHPVEYKRGKSKRDDRDIVQVAAQAMCLEEMLGVVVPGGSLFYGTTRRRQRISLDANLRVRVTDLAQQMHAVYDSRITPPPRRMPACKLCSIHDLCLPKIAAQKSVRRYVAAMTRGQENSPE